MPHKQKLQNEPTDVQSAFFHIASFHKASLATAILLAATLAWSQGPPPPPPAGGPGGGHHQGQPPPPRGEGGPAGGPGMHMPPGMWWTNPDVIQKINLTTDQQKKISDIFQQYRLKLIDADAAVRKEEAIMEPLVQSETPEDSKILAQIDKVAGARAELEKTDARMLLGIRHVLSPDQWKALQAGRPHDGPPPRRP